MENHPCGVRLALNDYFIRQVQLYTKVLFMSSQSVHTIDFRTNACFEPHDESQIKVSRNRPNASRQISSLDK